MQARKGGLDGKGREVLIPLVLTRYLYRSPVVGSMLPDTGKKLNKDLPVFRDHILGFGQLSI